jgi:hypothetical protein
VAAADKYQNAWNTLLVLGLSDDDSMFQPLGNSALWMKSTTERHIFGGSHIQNLWFWIVGWPSGLLDNEKAEWALEGMLCCHSMRNVSHININIVDQVKWFL